MTQEGPVEHIEATEAALSETVELFHYQSAASGSKLRGRMEQRVRSSPTPLPSSSPSRRDPPGRTVGEPSKEDFLMLKKLVETSTKKLRQQQQKEGAEVPLIKQTTPTKQKKTRGAMRKNNKKQQKQKQRSTPTATAGGVKKKKSWFLRMFGCKSRASKQIMERSNMEQAATMITPASSQAPSPEKQKTGKSSIASVGTSHSRRARSSQPTRSHVSRTSNSSSRPSKTSSSHAYSNTSSSNDEHDHHESIVEALAKRLEAMEASTSTTGAGKGAGRGTAGSADGYFPGEQRVNMSREPSEAPNSIAATQPIDNRQKTIQNKIPPAVKTVLSPSAVSSLAHEQPSMSPSNPALNSNVDNMRLLSTVEETDGRNLEQVLTSNLSRPPPVEVTLSPHQHQQSLSLSLSASYSGEDEDNGENETTDAQAEKKQQKPEQPRKSNREVISSTLSAANKELGVQQKQEQVLESSGKKMVLQSTAPGDPSQEVVADVSWWPSPPVLGDAEESTANGIEATASTAEKANGAAPEEPLLSEPTADIDDFKAFKNSVENNYMRLVQEKQSPKGSPKQDKAALPQATASDAPPQKKSQQPPRPTRSSNRSSSSSSSSTSAAKVLDTSLSATERAPDSNDDEPEHMQQPRPDKARGSSQPPPLTRRVQRRSRIVDSKLLVSEVEDGDGIEIEASILDISAYSDTSDQHQSPDTSMENMEAAAGSATHDETGDDTAKSDSDAAKKTSKDAAATRRTRKRNRMQRKRRKAAMKSSEEGWDGWGLHDEPRLTSNAISWDSDSDNKTPRASRRKNEPATPKQQQEAPSSGWFTLNALTSTRSLDAVETALTAKVTPPSKARSKSTATVKRKSKRKSRSKRRSSGELMDDDLFSDTDSDNRPEQDLPILMKKLTNQKIQKTVRMISREFKMTMSYQEDPLEDNVVAPVDSECSSDDEDDYEAGVEVETDYDEEDESSTTSRAYSDHEEGTVSSSSRADNSFFVGEEKKEVDSADLLVGSSANDITKQRSGWSAASLGMDYVCAPSREEILSMCSDSDA